MNKYSITQLHLPKSGNNTKDYEDAYGYIKKDFAEIQRLHAAIADGATESSFAVEWANMLVNCYVEEPFNDAIEFQTRIKSLSNDWHTTVFSRPLPWYAEEKARMGAFSTFIGLKITFDDSPLANSGHWNAIAIGDSCLFQIRDNSLNSVFPLKQAEDFTNSPILISSNLEKNSQCWDNVLNQSGKWQEKDIFFIISDALAAWFLRQCELGNHPWDELLVLSEKINCDTDFEHWIDKKRQTSQLKNDDVTCIIIKL